MKHPGIVEAPGPGRMGLEEGECWVMSRSRRYPPELLLRGVRTVQESGRPIAHVAGDPGITSEVLRRRVRRAEADRGERPAMLSTSEREELRALRREVAQLRRADAILKDATAYFAAELDPRRRGIGPGIWSTVISPPVAPDRRCIHRLASSDTGDLGSAPAAASPLGPAPSKPGESTNGDPAIDGIR